MSKNTPEFSTIQCAALEFDEVCLVELYATFAGHRFGADVLSVDFRLTVDGVLIPQTGTRVLEAGEGNTTFRGAIVRQISVGPGIHNFCLEWRAPGAGGGNGVAIQAASLPDSEHASLLIKTCLL